MKVKRQVAVGGLKTGKSPVKADSPEKPKHVTATQRARLQNVEYFRTLIENTSEAIVVVYPDGVIRYHNPFLLSMLGYGPREVLVADLLELIHPEDVERVHAALEGAEEDAGTSMLLEFRMKHKNRRWRNVECHMVNLLANDTVSGLVLSLRDITERTIAEREINENREQLRSLAMALTMAEEKQRRQLATELHDSIGQSLALANLKLGALLASGATQEHLARIDEIRAMIRDMIKTTRTLTFDLSPPVLYSVGFEAAIEWLGKRLRDEHGIEFKMHTFGTSRTMDENLMVLLFHAVRELLMNVVKHAEAENVKLFVSTGEEGINVVIEDDGVGFNTEILMRRRVDTEGFGLFSIHERLWHVGGRFEIQSVPGHGTTVSLSVPFIGREETDHEGENSAGG